MKFHGYETLLDFASKELKRLNQNATVPTNDWKNFYVRVLSHYVSQGWMKSMEGQLGIHRAQNEAWWYEDIRPYYKVWPAIIPALAKIKLDIPSDSLGLKRRTILIRFPEYREPDIGNNEKLLCMLTAVRRERTIDPQTLQTVNELGFRLVLNPVVNRDGKLDEVTGLSVPLKTSKTIAELLGESESSGQAEAKVLIQYALMIHLLADDPSIVQPDVLASDRDRFDKSTDPELRQRLIDKARKRGIVGFRIGEKFESIPHFRRPHPALFHTGKGRTVPRIVFRSGCVVHRDKMTKVPTGYITPEGVEVEPE